MKRIVYRLFWLLIVFGGLWGWGLAVRAIMAPVEHVISVSVTEESYEKAWGLCNRYMKTANGVIGQVALYTAVGEHLSLPCRVVVNER